MIQSANWRLTGVFMRQPLSRRAFALMTACVIAGIGGFLIWQLGQTVGIAQDNAAWMEWSQQLGSAVNSTGLVVRTLSAGGPLLADGAGSVSVTSVNGLASELRAGWDTLVQPPGASPELVSDTKQVIRFVETLADRLDALSSVAATGQGAAAVKMLEQVRRAPALAQLHDVLQGLSGMGLHDWRGYERQQNARLLNTVWINVTATEALIGLVAVLGIGLYWPVPARALPPFRRATDRVPDRLLDMVGHDLRQPLQAMGSFVSALERQAARPELALMIEGMRSATKSMDRMIGGLLDMSRLDAGRIIPELAEFDIADVLDPIRRECGSLAAEKQLDFRVSLIPGLVRTDPILVESILRNLVVNAIKYTGAGQVEVRVSGDGQRLTIDVEDTGPGIAAAEVDRIFDEFYRVKGTQRMADGLGLGLAVARRMAALLGLTIRVRSVVGRGSVFSVSIPRASPGGASLGGASARDPAGLAAPTKPWEALRGLRMLVVDDDPRIVQALRAELEPLGVAVTTAGSAGEAFALAGGHARREFDFALVDMNLGPEMTGTDLLDRLASECGVAVPALVMTGASDPRVLHELRRADYPWVHKPVSLAELTEWVARLRGAGQRGSRRSARLTEGGRGVRLLRPAPP